MTKAHVLYAALFISTSAVALAGCSSTSTGSSSSSSSSSGSSSSAGLEGSYAGTYKGDASGAVSMIISGSNIDVIVTVSSQNYPATGTVGAGGAVSLGVGAANGVTVTFNGTFAGGKGSGNWTNTLAQSGTWSVAK